MGIIICPLTCIVACAMVHSGETVERTDSLQLANNGESDYKIVISRTASEIVKHAVAELAMHLKQISDADIPIISDDQPVGRQEIIVGDSDHLKYVKASIDFQKLGNDGFAICASGKYLAMIGGSDQGTLYAVYSFLEKYLGCRWYSSKVSHIPRQNEIIIDQINETQIPSLKFREVYYADAMDPAFAARQKLNGNASIIQNGKLAREKHRGWGTWCHTFYTFVPPDKYFAEHPEYFSLINGKREPVSQLCVTNPDVLKITLAELKKRIQENPEDHYWDVSQNDRHSNCTCPNCQAIDDREGTHMGSVLEFVNKIASEFPDKTISTLSYQYTRRPPAKIRPAENVSIMLCSIECNRSKPIHTDPLSASFRSDVQDWSKICDKVFIWDYVVQFSNLVSPFPNLRVLQPNVKFFVANNSQGMFAQGNREVHGEFAHLRAYLLAKLLWDPDCDVNKIMDDFLSGYYGAAGPLIREYIDLMHDELEKSGKPLNIFGGTKDHIDGYLSEELIARYDEIFDNAEKSVTSDPEVLLRVQEARMPLMYAKLELGLGDLPERKEIAERLFSIADSVGLLAFNEWNLPIEKYRADVMSRF
jgi:hypothetical protein